MTSGIGRYVALVLAVCVCIARPGLLSLAVFLLVFAAVLLIQPGAEDPGKRREERDRS